MPHLNAVYVMDPVDWGKIYSHEERETIGRMVKILGPVYSPKDAVRHPDILRRADILISGWGGPRLDETFLAMMPNLKLVLYGAGSVFYMITPALLRRGIPVSTANHINAIPVAEFSFAHIILALKSYRRNKDETYRRRAFFTPQIKGAGGFRSKIGLISLGTIGRLVRQRLRTMDVSILAYDPYFDKLEATALDITMTGLDKLFIESDVVSLHSPLTGDTEGLITGDMFAGMKPGATFINTARGAIVREKEMIEVLKERTDLTAILDVTDPEPPAMDCELFDLPNVWLSPHIAGSLDRECSRMGNWVVQELGRYLTGEPLLGLIEHAGAAGSTAEVVGVNL